MEQFVELRSQVPVTSRHCLIKVCFFDRKRNFIYLCWLEMTFSSGVVSEKLHFLPCTSFYILPASVSNYLSRDSTDEMVTAHTGSRAHWAHLFSASCSWMTHWSLEREHCRNVYSMKISKHYKGGLIFLESQLLNIHQDTTGWSIPFFNLLLSQMNNSV